MNIGLVVQVRMSSSRLPGKALREIAGKPMLEYQIERLLRSTIGNNLVIATSDEESDNPLEDYCVKNKVNFFRGNLHNVALRFKNLLDQYHFDAFVRISGDSPFMDQAIVDKCVDIFNSGKYDLVTNVLLRSFPKGISVEVIRKDTFLKAYDEFSSYGHFEHVTPYFYENNERFTLYNLEHYPVMGDIQLSVDTPEEFERFGAIIDVMDKPHWQYTLDDVLAIYNSLRVA